MNFITRHLTKKVSSGFASYISSSLAYQYSRQLEDHNPNFLSREYKAPIDYSKLSIKDINELLENTKLNELAKLVIDCSEDSSINNHMILKRIEINIMRNIKTLDINETIKILEAYKNCKNSYRLNNSTLSTLCLKLMKEKNWSSNEIYLKLISKNVIWYRYVDQSFILFLDSKLYKAKFTPEIAELAYFTCRYFPIKLQIYDIMIKKFVNGNFIPKNNLLLIKYIIILDTLCLQNKNENNLEILKNMKLGLKQGLNEYLQHKFVKNNNKLAKVINSNANIATINNSSVTNVNNTNSNLNANANPSTNNTFTISTNVNDNANDFSIQHQNSTSNSTNNHQYINNFVNRYNLCQDIYVYYNSYKETLNNHNSKYFNFMYGYTNDYIISILEIFDFKKIHPLELIKFQEILRFSIVNQQYNIINYLIIKHFHKILLNNIIYYIKQSDKINDMSGYFQQKFYDNLIEQIKKNSKDPNWMQKNQNDIRNFKNMLNEFDYYPTFDY